MDTKATVNVGEYSRGGRSRGLQPVQAWDQAASKEHGTAWRTATLAMPGGENLPYNAMTIDVFPNWAALGKGIPAREIWNKVHPNRDISAHLARLAEIRDRPRVDVLRIVEFIEK